MENGNWGDLCSEGFNTLFLSSSGDGLYGPYRAEGHIRLGSYIDPWRGERTAKETQQSKPSIAE